MRVHWKAHRCSGIDFIGEITDLTGIDTEKPFELAKERPDGVLMAFIWHHFMPYQESPLLILRQVLLWGQNVDNLKNYVDNNYRVIGWSPLSTIVSRFPTSYPHSPTIKILENDRKKQVFEDFSTITHHYNGFRFEF